jgi:hypothetical protein
MQKIFIGLIVLTLLGGVIFSIRDYQNWRHSELDRYGQGGPGPQVPTPAPLGRLYSHPFGKIRFKIPVGWVVTENKAYLPGRLPTPELEKGQRVLLAQLDDEQKTVHTDVFEESAEGVDLPLFINNYAAGAEGEREFINTDNVNMTVLTWKMPIAKQVAITSNNKRILIMVTTFSSSSWEKYAQTFSNVYRSVVWF